MNSLKMRNIVSNIITQMFNGDVLNNPEQLETLLESLYQCGYNDGLFQTEASKQKEIPILLKKV